MVLLMLAVLMLTTYVPAFALWLPAGVSLEYRPVERMRCGSSYHDLPTCKGTI